MGNDGEKMMVEAMGLRMGPVRQVSHVDLPKCVVTENPMIGQWSLAYSHLVRPKLEAKAQYLTSSFKNHRLSLSHTNTCESWTSPFRVYLVLIV